MTKKHYTATAQVIKDNYDKQWICDSARYNIATSLADYFEQDNIKFNRDMFLQACGIES